MRVPQSVNPSSALSYIIPKNRAFLAKFPSDCLFEVYGSTELGVNTILRPEDQLRKPGSCGQVAPGMEIVLLDDDGSEALSGPRRGNWPRPPGHLHSAHRAGDRGARGLR